MNLVDFILCVLILTAVWSGWKRGFIAGFADIVLWLGSWIIAFALYPDLSDFIVRHFPSVGVWSTPLSFLFLLIISRLVLSTLFLRIGIPREAHEHRINQVFGLATGFVNGLIYAMLAAVLLLAFPISTRLSESARESRIAAELTPVAEWAEGQLFPVFDQAIQKTLNKVTVAPDSRETIKLPFQTTDTKERPDLEVEMLEMLNKERVQRGFKPLVMDTALVKVARTHSRDMFARRYFSHVNPDGEDPFDRIRKAKIRFLTAGENLALAQTLGIAHQGLMNSPGHRANILKSTFGRVGIGVISGGLYGLMITQVFRN